MSKIKQVFPKTEINITKNSGSTKSRKGNIEMKMRTSQNNDMTTIQQQLNMMNLGQKLKSPKFKIPMETFQLKQKYLNRQFINNNMKEKRQIARKKDKINHSMIYDQIHNVDK